MASLERPPSSEPEEPSIRVEARSAEDIHAGKTEEYEIIPYEDEVFSFPSEALPRYKPFDAARELQNIRRIRGEARSATQKGSRAEIKSRLTELREMTVRQGEGVSVVIRALERMVRANPDIYNVALWRTVMEFAPKFRFADSQLERFWGAITAYGTRHAAVEKYREEFSDDARLFEECFGRAPKGKVQVFKEPMMLYVRCYDDNDYAFAYTLNETDGEEKRLTLALRERAMRSAGAATWTKLFALRGAVAIERASAILVAGKFAGHGVVNEKQSADIRAHEGQHLMNRLFEPLRWKVSETEIMARVARVAKTPEEAKRMLMVELARSARQVIGMDNEARDEILAFYRDGSSREYIMAMLTREPLYAYREAKRYKDRIKVLPGMIAVTIARNMSVVIDGPGGKEAVSLLTFASEVKPFVEKAFGEEYEKDVARWVEAIEALEKKGYSRDEIVSMLYGERVIDWSSFARRAPGKPESRRTPDIKRQM